jgi:hypothetical protein
MTKYTVNYTRAAIDGFSEKKFDIPVEALDPAAAALIAGAIILADTLESSPVGEYLRAFGVSLTEIGGITADAFKDCVTVTVTSV